jgi:protein-S-isoprenylcysteine O-methyltransferase Ste14/membrane-associated phospholipid phosphatase
MNTSSYGKLLYGSFFVVILPLSLFLWARATNDLIVLPIIENQILGIIILLCGIIVMSIGMITLIMRGNGLPMNAYPPKNYVHSGIYKYLSHPIYVGFCSIVIGCSIVFQSPSGLWLVSPVLILGCIALIYGFEHHDLRERFGNSISKPIISLPSPEDTPATIAERISVYLLVFLPWLVLYEAVITLGIPSDAIAIYFPFEKNLAVIEWTELFYASTYLFVILVPLLSVTSRQLRTFAVNGLVATAIIMFCFIMVPFIAPPRPFIPTGLFGKLLQLERTYDGPSAAFPSFHVVWSMLASITFSQSLPKGKQLWWIWCFAISVSCVTTGMHTLIDVIGGWVAGFSVLNIKSIWEKVRKITEQIANSWREWRIGPVRIINHGGYVALGTFGGLCLVGSIIGSSAITSMLLIAFCSLIGSGLWAQFVEGSPSLLRPFGYYGGVLGVIVGCIVSFLLRTDLWLLFAAFAIAGPWIQAAGRLRCLVQGCCHGHESSFIVGIRYTHPRSRVCRLSNLTNIPIHPTPLYSILWNIVTGIVLIRLYFVAAPSPLIAGLYLILNGLGRFVEESFRGEPQTALFGKLRLYQWLAIASVVAGLLFTTVHHSLLPPTIQFDMKVFFASLFFGLCTWFAMGVDFPNSNKRFSRLV